VTTPNPGPGVDIRGQPVVDPTENVLQLVEAAVRRLDDLRQMETHHQAEKAGLIAEHLASIAQLRADYGEKLRLAESARIDAIRAVDVGAVQRAAEVSAQQAQTLAVQVATSAEALRAQVSAAQAAAASSLAAALEPMQRSIDDLRRAQYEAQGQRTQVVESRGASGTVIAAIGIGLTLLVVLIALAGLLLTK
jgi:cobalamin biosynthesis Mg chelatase CobN